MQASSFIGAVGCGVLAAELAKGAFQSLTTLYLGSNALGSEGCETLAMAFLSGYNAHGTAALPHLQRLHLYDNGIGKAGAMALGVQAMTTPSCSLGRQSIAVTTVPLRLA